MILVVGCGGGDNPGDVESTVELEFEAVVGDESFSCDRDYDHFGAGEQKVAITDARFYVHDVEITDGDGESRSVELASDDRWQLSEVGLLDFTDGTGHCRQAPSASNRTVEVVADVDEIGSVSFSIGVPFDLNHNDVATAPSPLNRPGMFWYWNGGYKFVRIDIEADDDPFRFHLGSAQCQPGDDGGVEGCNEPNRPRVVIDSFDPEQERLQFDLAALFGATNVAEITDQTPQGCMSTPDDPDCDGLYDRLNVGDDEPVDEAVIRAVDDGESGR